MTGPTSVPSRVSGTIVPGVTGVRAYRGVVVPVTVSTDVVITTTTIDSGPEEPHQVT